MDLSNLTSNARWKVKTAWRRSEGNLVLVKRGQSKGWKVKVIDKEALFLRLVEVLKLKGWEVVERE